MKESTRAQIEAMKNQTIGVEVEMYGISRENAAKTAATFFGTGRYEYTATFSRILLHRYFDPDTMRPILLHRCY